MHERLISNSERTIVGVPFYEGENPEVLDRQSSYNADIALIL